MNQRFPSEDIPHTSRCTLKQVFDWIEKRETALGDFWDRVKGARIDEVIEFTRDYHANGGCSQMTPLKFYLIDHFSRDADTADILYTVITQLMKLPFDLWSHIEIDLLTYKARLLESGQKRFHKWAKDHPDDLD
jgi:hypothetical protein